MKKQKCFIFTVLVLFAFLLAGGIAVYAESPTDLQKDEALSEFLSIDVLGRSVSDSILFDLKMDPVYDCRDDDRAKDMIIEFMIAGFPTESGTSINHESEIEDPRGLYGGEAGRCPADEVDRVAMEYFNCSEDALEMAKLEDKTDHFYYTDGYYYYNDIGGYGVDSYEPRIRYAAKAGDRYHLFYDVYVEFMGEDDPPEYAWSEYAEVGKKEIDGKEQWTLYMLSYDPEILATGSPYMPPVERVKYMAYWLADQTSEKAAAELIKQNKERMAKQTQALVQEIKGKYGTVSSEAFTSCLGTEVQSYPGSAIGCISVKPVDLDHDGTEELIALRSEHRNDEEALILDLYQNNEGSAKLVDSKDIGFMDYCSGLNIYLFYSNPLKQYCVVLEGNDFGTFTGAYSNYSSVYMILNSTIKKYDTQTFVSMGMGGVDPLEYGDPVGLLKKVGAPYIKYCVGWDPEYGSKSADSSYQQLGEVLHECYGDVDYTEGRNHRLQILGN